MVVRVDMCCTFGIKNTSSKSAQYLPKLSLMRNLCLESKVKNLSVIADAFQLQYVQTNA